MSEKSLFHGFGKERTYTDGTEDVVTLTCVKNTTISAIRKNVRIGRISLTERFQQKKQWRACNFFYGKRTQYESRRTRTE